jgi:hypothetical protein
MGANMFAIIVIKKIYKIIKLTPFLSLPLLFLHCICYGTSINLVWEANLEEDLAGYKIYYGTSPGNYGPPTDTGNTTEFELSGLNEGTTYYIALTAYDTFHNESEKSDEVHVVNKISEICSDGIDNDGDGSTDCEDQECDKYVCNDGDLCTEGDICMAGNCVGTVIACNDGNICNGNETCQAGVCTADIPLHCNDNNSCNGIETCDPVAGCQAGIPLNCNDENVCTDDTCDPVLGCVHTLNTAPCDDGLYCNGEDTCREGSCAIHTGDPCGLLPCDEEKDLCKAEEIICDNGEPCTSYSGKWYTSGGSNPYGTSSLFSRNGATYSWTPTLPQAGYYEVYIWWTEYSSRCTNCPVTISCGGEVLDTVSSNQLQNGGQWNYLGIYDLESGTNCSVTITAEGAPSTCADAVKFLFFGEDPPKAIIDSIDPNPAESGEVVYFTGHAIAGEGKTIEGYSWVSNLNGEMSTDASFSASSLPEGINQIIFKAKDSDGVWSVPAKETLYIGPIEIICDNGEPCTSFSGNWYPSGGSNPYGTNSLYSRNGATYSWTFTLPKSGSYEVFMWWTEWSTRCTNCPVTISSGGEIVDTLSIDQLHDGGKWNLLGTYNLDAGDTCSVIITAEGLPSTCADSVKFYLQ